MALYIGKEEADDQQSVRAVENFIARYKEWAEKADNDYNVMALNRVVMLAKATIKRYNDILDGQ